MPTYEPVETGVPLQASLSDLVSFDWQGTGVAAEFTLPAEPNFLLRVTFAGECIVRLLDEMPLSTESDSAAEGLVRENFAYRVTGSSFECAQSQAWKAGRAPVIHFRFVTGSGCMDVLSAASPTFQRVSKDPS